MYQVLDSEGNVQMIYSTLVSAAIFAIEEGYITIRNTEKGITVYNIALGLEPLK